MTEEELQKHFDLFYEDFFIEVAKYGEVEKMKVCDNVGDHLVGNVYIRYRYEEDALKAVEDLNNRFYAGNIYIYSIYLIIFFIFYFLQLFFTIIFYNYFILLKLILVQFYYT